MYIEQLGTGGSHQTAKLIAEVIQFTQGKVVVNYLESNRLSIHDDLLSLKKSLVGDDYVIVEEITNAFSKGFIDATQDVCENAHFKSVGGEEHRFDMEPPSYVAKEEEPDYLAGYRAGCVELFGGLWK